MRSKPIIANSLLKKFRCTFLTFLIANGNFFFAFFVVVTSIRGKNGFRDRYILESDWNE